MSFNELSSRKDRKRSSERQRPGAKNYQNNANEKQKKRQWLEEQLNSEKKRRPNKKRAWTRSPSSVVVGSRASRLLMARGWSPDRITSRMSSRVLAPTRPGDVHRVGVTVRVVRRRWPTKRP